MIISLNKRLIITLNFMLLWGISATYNILSCGGVFNFSFFHGMSLNFFFADFYFPSFFNTTVSSSVLSDGCGHLFTAAAISVVVYTRPKLTSHHLVEYIIRRGAFGCWSAAFFDSIYPLKLNGNTALQICHFAPGFYACIMCLSKQALFAELSIFFCD